MLAAVVPAAAPAEDTDTGAAGAANETGAVSDTSATTPVSNDTAADSASFEAVRAALHLLGASVPEPGAAAPGRCGEQPLVSRVSGMNALASWFLFSRA